MRDTRVRSGRLERAAEWLVDLIRGATPAGRGVMIAAVATGIAGAQSDATQVHLIAAAAFGLLIASLIVRRLWRLDGVRVRLSAPRRVTAGESVALSLEVHNDGDRTHQDVRVNGPSLPAGAEWVEQGPAIPLLPGGERACVRCAARFTARGEFTLEPFRLAAVLPLGLFKGPSVSSQRCRFTVVPAAARVARVQLPPAHERQIEGCPQASSTGDSLELLGVRPYRPGDPVRHLHARSWARTGVPVVREFLRESLPRIGIVLDTDVSAGNRRQLEACVSVAAGAIAALSADLARVEVLVTNGRRHRLGDGADSRMQVALDLLAGVRAGVTPHREGILASLAPDLHHLSCVVMIARRWDEARASITRAIEATGVSCRVVLVEPPRVDGSGDDRAEAAERPSAKLIRITTESVEKGEVLWL
ncbi:MAG TPA: DUF58 domain-containing protein [Polyangiaceae bacterium]|nr:DUF58 domain-containing protein [Polyangiaceae bacterium]